MIQTIAVFAIVAAAAAWTGRAVWRFWHPKAGGGCGCGCCAGAPEASASTAETPPHASPERPRKPREVMVAASDLRARVQARRP